MASRPGHHPALIDFATFQTSQRRLNGSAKRLVRTDDSQDFALRGHVVCACCGTRLTSCWAKGSHGCYPDYHCRDKTCEAYGRSIPRARIEGEFGELLNTLQPSATMFDMTHQALRTLWDEQSDKAAERKNALAVNIRAVDAEIGKLVDCVVETESAPLITAYEKRIAEAEARKIALAEKTKNCGPPFAGFDAAFRTAMAFLANPYKLWVQLASSLRT